MKKRMPTLDDFINESQLIDTKLSGFAYSISSKKHRLIALDVVLDFNKLGYKKDDIQVFLDNGWRLNLLDDILKILATDKVINNDNDWTIDPSELAKTSNGLKGKMYIENIAS